ncbi:MAG: matrixin family metalloprotease [Bryobacterales bacterium]|nr:matrixin family metalloprotease [Bryobacterales bacterium]
MKLKAIFQLIFLVEAGIPVLLAQPGVYLKGGATATQSRGLGASVAEKRQNSDHWHWLLVYPQAPGRQDVEDLAALGARVVQFAPERGLIASVPDGASLDSLALAWRGRLRPEQKVSPLLVDAGLLGGGETEQTILVEFHLDVTRADMTAIASKEGVQVADNPDLVGWQLMVKGPESRLARLAEWDEVSYLFPVSRELADGRPVEACGGALAETGRIGQIVAQVSQGWDGAGLGAVELGYFFSSYTGRLTPAQAQSEVVRAMKEWAKYAKISFAPGSSAQARKTINILFATGDHGDGYPFDGPGHTLAHTFYPSPPNTEPLAGDLHLDDDEPWQLGTNVDLFSVVLHELGHALGLGHSDNPQSVMYPYYRLVTGLRGEDISAIQQLYKAQDGTPSVTAPVTPAAPSPANPLTLTVTLPNTNILTTQADQVTISGTTGGGTGAVQVSWTNARGGAGAAEGWRPWSIASVALQMGENVVTITAVDSAQGRTARELRITRESVPTPAAPSPSPQPVTIQIVTPVAAGRYVSGQPAVTLSGTAGPAGRVAGIQWLNTRGSGGQALGSAAWTTSPVPLEAGANHITVIATDANGLTASASIDVDYTPPPVVADTVAPALSVLFPLSTAITTSQPAFTIVGTASDNTGVVLVDWVGNGNRGGKADGSTNWRIADVPLFTGSNMITIRAWDAAGNMSWRSLSITRQ